MQTVWIAAFGLLLGVCVSYKTKVSRERENTLVCTSPGVNQAAATVQTLGLYIDVF